MARPERFELPTLGFEVRCSIQLSYGRGESFVARLRNLERLHCRVHCRASGKPVDAKPGLKTFGLRADARQKPAKRQLQPRTATTGAGKDRLSSSPSTLTDSATAPISEISVPAITRPPKTSWCGLMSALK